MEPFVLKDADPDLAPYEPAEHDDSQQCRHEFVRTENRSVYELCDTQQLIRRNMGTDAPTARIGDSWRKYGYLAVLDGGLWIDWDGLGHGTLTSTICATWSGDPQQ